MAETDHPNADVQDAAPNAAMAVASLRVAGAILKDEVVSLEVSGGIIVGMLMDN